MNQKRNHPGYRKIYEEYYGIKIPKGFHIHHIDGDCTNNDPLNLECLSPQDHAQKHEHMKNFVSVSTLACKKGGTVQGRRNKENGHWNNIIPLGNTPEAIKKRNEGCKILGIGFYSDTVKKLRSELGTKLKEEKRGIFSEENRKNEQEKINNGTHVLLNLTSDQLKQRVEKRNETLKNEKINDPIKYFERFEQFTSIGKISRMFVWEVENKDGTKLEVINLSKFCRDNQLSVGTLRMTSIGDREWHKNWRCKKLRKITKEEFYKDLNGHNN